MRYRKLLARAVAASGLSTVLLFTGCDVGVEDDANGAPSTPPASPQSPESSDEPANQPAAASPPLMLVMDASGSMNETGPDGELLLDSAKQALHDLVSALPDEQEVGLRVYGHRVPNTDKENGCQDTELIHPVAPLDRDTLNQAIDSFDAVGFTPIGLSLEEAANDLPPEGARTIVLISDGEDTCAPPAPCDVASDLREAGVELVINTVGFALGDNDQARQELECIAEEGGGVYQDADDAAELGDALEESTRDQREAQLAGDVLEGAPLPRDANTGQVNTAYRDTVLGLEGNFYRFEVPAGSEVEGEVIASYGGEIAQCPGVQMYAYLADENGTELSSGQYVSVGQTRPEVYVTAAETPGTEVWLVVETTNDFCADAELDLEIQVRTR